MKITIEDEYVKATVESDAVGIGKSMELVEQALRGFGYHFDGHLEVVDHEEEERD